jgi:hypothetical protein
MEPQEPKTPPRGDSPPPGDESLSEDAPRFDPYTGKPLLPEAPSDPPQHRFDPYTGKPIDASEARSSRRPLIIAGAVVLIVILGVGLWALLRSGSNAVLGTQTNTLTITLDLYNPADPSIGRYGKGCDVSDTGYDDISTGAPVTVKDKSGTVLASSFLGSGTSAGSDCLSLWPSRFRTQISIRSRLDIEALCRSQRAIFSRTVGPRISQ